MKTLIALVVGAVIVGVTTFTSAWALMLVIGIVHAQVLTIVVPVGFKVAWSLTLAACVPVIPVWFISGLIKGLTD